MKYPHQPQLRLVLFWGPQKVILALRLWEGDSR
jgi:hypothetical protein